MEVTETKVGKKKKESSKRKMDFFSPREFEKVRFPLLSNSILIFYKLLFLVY